MPAATSIFCPVVAKVSAWVSVLTGLPLRPVLVSLPVLPSTNRSACLWVLVVELVLARLVVVVDPAVLVVLPLVPLTVPVTVIVPPVVTVALATPLPVLAPEPPPALAVAVLEVPVAPVVEDAPEVVLVVWLVDVLGEPEALVALGVLAPAGVAIGSALLPELPEQPRPISETMHPMHRRRDMQNPPRFVMSDLRCLRELDVNQLFGLVAGMVEPLCRGVGGIQVQS